MKGFQNEPQVKKKGQNLISQKKSWKARKADEIFQKRIETAQIVEKKYKNSSIGP